MMWLGSSNVAGVRGTFRLVALLGTGLMLAGCLPGGPPGDPSGAARRGSVAAPKVLRLGMLSGEEPKDGIIHFSSSSATGLEYGYVLHSGLTVYDAQDNLQPRVAQKVPTVEDGDWKIFPDGQMEVTWKLRPNVKWHDGAPATAADFAFGLQALQDPEFPGTRSQAARLISEVSIPDPSTLLLRWRQVFIYANASGPRDLPALPRHLMGELYETGDKQGFFNSPLWTNQFVGLGPYRLSDWVVGTRLEAVAFDDYFLGRPRIDRVVYEFVGDNNALVVSLRAGAVDMTPYGNLETPQITELKKAWDPTGAGTTFATYRGTRAYSFQLRNSEAPWADARVRRALAHMLDRQALVDSLMGGAGSVADIIVSPGDPTYRLLEQRGLTRYPFDLGQAQRLLTDAGWTRAPGGAYRSSAGQPLTIDIISSDAPQNVTEAAAVGGLWKAGGLADVTFSLVPTTATNAVKNELRHTFTGAQGIQTSDEIASMYWTTSQIGTAENRWTGGNRGGYSNPEYDRLHEQALVTLDLGRRQALIADFLKLLADDVPMIHIFYDPGLASGAVRKGIHGPGPAGSSKQLITTWNIHEWGTD